MPELGGSMQLGADDVRRVERAGELLEFTALSGDGLPTAFPQVAKLLNGSMFQLFNYTNPEAPDLVVAPECAGVFVDYIEKGWHALDTYSHAGARFPKHGLIISDLTLIDGAVRSRDQFYQEFMPKWDMGGFTSWTFDLAGERWAFTHMSHTGRPLGQRGVEMMRRLIPAADRSALLAAIVKDARVGGIADGLERGFRPAFVIDHMGRLMMANPSAQKLLGPDLFLRNGQVRAKDRKGDAWLRHMALAAGMSLPPPLQNFAIARQGRRPLFAMPIAVRDRGIDRLPGARIILVMTDVEAKTQQSLATLQGVFDLSPREAQLVLALSNGADVEAAAKSLGISTATTRHMLKSIFSKTGIHRQSELLLLVARLP